MPVTARNLTLVATLCVALAGAPATGGQAIEELDPALRTAAIARGEALFRTYCASCHGVGGRGDGAVAEHLRVAPTDVTRISSVHGGEFPRAWVHEVIDGRAEVGAHGDREMPVWGHVFQTPRVELGGRPVAIGPNLATRRVRQLVEYLVSIQTEPQRQPRGKAQTVEEPPAAHP